MTDGTSQGMFIVVAIVIFGIFVVMAYILFEDTLSPAMASMFTDASETTTENIGNNRFIGKNLLVDGNRLRHGPDVGYSGSEIQGKIPGVEGKEFISYADVNPIFERFGIGTYTFSFDIKATIPGYMRVYSNTGGTKYIFEQAFEVSTEWERKSFVVEVTELDSESSVYNPNITPLGFYGRYGSGRSPSVKNVKIELGAVEGIPEYIPAPITLRY